MTQLSEALALRRGPPLADVPATPAVTAYTVRLEQARMSALEDCLGLKGGGLASGIHQRA